MGVGERWHNGAGSLPDLRYPVTPMLAHMLARAVDGTDFRASRSGGGSEAAAAHSRRECGRAMARRRRQRSLPTFGSPVTRMLAHMLARAVDGTDFRASRSGGGSKPAAAHSLNGCGRAMAQRRGQFAGPWISGHTDALHACWRGRLVHGTDFRASRSGGGSEPAAAHSLRECGRAMARRRGRFADLRDSVYSDFNMHPLLALTNATLISPLS